jgi:L-2-hydroxyglutarate oxidase
MQPPVVVIGGGIVGLAVAATFLDRHPGSPLTLLEKEPALGRHQSSHNSGVIHSGVYYKPGSLKARNCTRGKQLMEEFCRSHAIPFETCGKVVVAAAEHEVPRLHEIHARASANGVHCSMLTREQLAQVEPHAAGLCALHVPGTGIVEYPQVCAKLAELITAAGGTIRTGAQVRRVEHAPSVVRTSDGDVPARFVVACAGLFSDRLARASGLDPGVSILPVRGEYYHLTNNAAHLCRGLIYPVPDPAFPFLGVHLTRTLHGGVECGPNAVLALAREGYRHGSISPAHIAELLTSRPVRRFVARHWRTGMGELRRSLSRPAFAQALRRLVPKLEDQDLVRAGAGVRAQALRPDGTLADDFIFAEGENSLHVLNAPSPAATASLSLAITICERVEQRLGLAAPAVSSAVAGR